MNVNTYDSTPAFDGVIDFSDPYRYYRRVNGLTPYLYRHDGTSPFVEYQDPSKHAPDDWTVSSWPPHTLIPDHFERVVVTV